MLDILVETWNRKVEVRGERIGKVRRWLWGEEGA